MANRYLSLDAASRAIKGNARKAINAKELSCVHVRRHRRHPTYFRRNQEVMVPMWAVRSYKILKGVK